MKKTLFFALIALGMSLAPLRLAACELHMMFNPKNMGMVDGALVKMSGLATPKKVFQLEHTAMTKAVVGEESEIAVTYTRPYFSSKVRLELLGTSNIELEQKVFELEERTGTINIPYQLSGSGYDSISLTIVGMHQGTEVREFGRIYVRAKKPSAEQEQLSQR